MSTVIAVLSDAVEHYPLWQWLPPNLDLRLVIAADAGPVPVPYEPLGAHDRSARLSQVLGRWCAHRQPARIVHLDAADTQRVAAVRSVHGVAGQHLASAVVYSDRAILRERLGSAGVPVLAHLAVERPSDVYDFADGHGYPVRVRPRFVQAPWSGTVLATPAQARTWTHGPYHDAPRAWIVEAAGAAARLRADALYRDGSAELVWVAESYMVNGATGQRRMTVALEHDDPRASEARRLLGSALGALPDPDVALVHAELRETSTGLAVADLGCGIDPEYPRSLIRAALGVDPVRRYVQAAAGLPLPPAAEHAAHVTGRIELLARRSVLEALDPLPDALAGPGTVLPAAGDRFRGGEPDARFDTAGPDRAAVTAALEQFAAWFAQAAHFRRPTSAAA